MTQLTRATRLVRNPDLIATDMDGDTVMMSITRGEYYGLGGVGGRIWSLLERPMLIRALCVEYEVDEARCEADVLSFTGVLLEHGAVETC